MSTNHSAKSFPSGKQSKKKEKKFVSSSSSNATPVNMNDDLMVYISRRVILQIVGSAIRQEVQGYLHFTYLDGTIQVSVHMGAVYSTGSINENPLIFEGESVATQDEAEEGAAQAVLDYICENYAITINDYNYSVLQATNQKLLSAQEKIRAKHWQFNMAKREVAARQAETVTQTETLAHICNDFLDAMPLCMHPHRPFTEDRIISYTGSCPPITRLKHFAKVLYYFIIGTNPRGECSRMT